MIYNLKTKFQRSVLKGFDILENCFGKIKALNSFRSLENNPDDDGHIIRIHFRVSKRGIAAKLFKRKLFGKFEFGFGNSKDN